jgi:alkylhydroperoxidase family enzyme
VSTASDGPYRADVTKLPAAEGLAGHPGLQRFVQCYLETFLVDGRLDPRLRELAILRIAWRCGQAYEWASHHRIARRIGVGDDAVLAVRQGPDADGLTAAERAALTAADEVVDLGRITEATLDRCRTAFDGREDLTLELVHLLAGYRSMAIILDTNRPPLAAAGLTGWPPDGVGPDGVGADVGPRA